ncbi:MAG TPA: hypothetical protein VK673_21890 [Chthoniobacterales bacterium]|nr:hypothetical protein [Chthoniobacterales bacterium]
MNKIKYSILSGGPLDGSQGPPVVWPGKFFLVRDPLETKPLLRDWRGPGRHFRYERLDAKTFTYCGTVEVSAEEIP